MEARSQTAPQAHMRRDATLLLSPLGRDSSNTGRIRNRALLNRGLSVGFKGIEPVRNRRAGNPEGRAQPGSRMGGSRPPEPPGEKQNFRDREHFGWGPVSKTIEGAGHPVFYRCFVSRALQDRAPWQHRSPRRAGGMIWGRRAEWPQPETGRWVRRRIGRCQECLSCGKVGGH